MFSMHADGDNVAVRGWILCLHSYTYVCVLICGIDINCVCVWWKKETEGDFAMYHWLAARGTHSWLCKSKINQELQTF